MYVKLPVEQMKALEKYYYLLALSPMVDSFARGPSIREINMIYNVHIGDKQSIIVMVPYVDWRNMDAA